MSARRGPVLWSHVLDVRSRDCPFVAALLTFEASDTSFVTDMSHDAQLPVSCGNHYRTRRATPEIAESAWLLIMTRDDLADLDPAALTYHPASLAELLTIFGDDLAASDCPCAVS